MFSWRVTISLVTLVLSMSCVQQQPAQLTAEEAGWQWEVKPIVDAACSVGAPVQVAVAQTTAICGVGENCVFKTVPQYATHHVTELPKLQTDRSWEEERERVSALLPPDDLVALHTSVLQTLEAQLSLDDTTSPLTGDQRSAVLEKRAAELCASFNQFNTSAMTRPVPPQLAASSYSLSFQPVGSPASFGVNSSGQFSVSFNESIPTPYGNVTFSSSKSTASSTKPKRLVVRSNGRQRVLFMDRDFEIWIPATLGVRVTNTDTDFIIDVDSKVPVTTPVSHGKKRSQRSA